MEDRKTAGLPMTTAKDFRLLSLQVSIFTPTLLFSTSKIFEKLMCKYASIFNGDTLSIPLPPNTPKEIPRIILPSSDGKLKLEIAENRANFFRYRQEDDTKIDEESFFKICLEIFKDYIDCTSATVGRLAVVAVRFCEKENPGVELAKHFCKDRYITEPFNRPQNFEIHAHKIYKFDDFEVNSWVRCKTGTLAKENKPIMVVQEDINTLAEKIDQNNYDHKQMKKFIELTIKEQEAILKKYFPNE